MTDETGSFELTEGEPPSLRSTPATPLAPDDPRRVAIQIRDGALPAFMYMTVAEVFGHGGAEAFRLYRDRLLADCGLAPGADPIAVMLVEQLALAHLNVGRLHSCAATAAGLDEFKAYAAAAAGLAGEFRRGALALKAYREPGRAAEPAELSVAGDVETTRGKSPRRRTGS